MLPSQVLRRSSIKSNNLINKEKFIPFKGLLNSNMFYSAYLLFNVISDKFLNPKLISSMELNNQMTPLSHAFNHHNIYRY